MNARLCKFLLRGSDYGDFDLLIWKAPKGYRARVQGSTGGVAHADFAPPFAEGELQEMLSSISVARRDLAPAPRERRDPLREIGTRLFQTVFRGDIEVFWRRRLEEAEAAEKGLRLRLHLDTPELWDLPWEYLYDPNREFLAISPVTPVVRYIEMPDVPRPIRVAPPLRLLLITASPRGFAGLAVEQEITDLKSALAPLIKTRKIEVSYLPGANRTSLCQQLRQTCHVLHFIGHGQGGALLLESPDGEADPVTGEELSLILRLQPKLRLVVLNACEGARGDPSSPFASATQALVKARIPAVVAMQFAISDRTALSFSRSFYSAIAARDPVDRAISEARNAMAVEQIPEWGTPVLAMRSPDGHLFKLSRWEALVATVRKIRRASSKRWLMISLLVLTSTAFCLAIGVRRSLDPNQLFSLFNPSYCPSPPGVPIAFVEITPGVFTMGSDSPPEEAPRHEVRITRPFCLSRFEVTEALWRQITHENPRHGLGDRFPVENVSWEDTQRFLADLRRLESVGIFRRPFEAEWEYAAKAGGPGPEQGKVGEYGNCVGSNSKRPMPVGSLAPNAWGLYDMLGNSCEWVEDWYGPYTSATEIDPQGPKTGAMKIRRGASFRNSLRNCRPTLRERSAPTSRSSGFGFRVVREPVLQR